MIASTASIPNWSRTSRISEYAAWTRVTRSERPALRTASSGQGQHLRVAVQPDGSSAGPEPLRQRHEMAAAAGRAVNEDRARALDGLEPRGDLVNQHRLVNRSHGGFRSKKRGDEPAAAGNRRVQQATLAQPPGLSRAESDGVACQFWPSCSRTASINFTLGLSHLGEDVPEPRYLDEVEPPKVLVGLEREPTGFCRLVHPIGQDETVMSAPQERVNLLLEVPAIRAIRSRMWRGIGENKKADWASELAAQ